MKLKKENSLDAIHLSYHEIFIFLGVLVSHRNDICAAVSLYTSRLSIPNKFAGVCLKNRKLTQTSKIDPAEVNKNVCISKASRDNPEMCFFLILA